MSTIEEIRTNARALDSVLKYCSKTDADPVLVTVNEAYELGKSESVPLVWAEQTDNEGNTFYYANIEESGELYYHIDPWFDACLMFSGDSLIDMRANIETHPDYPKTLEESKILCQDHYDQMSGRTK